MLTIKCVTQGGGGGEIPRQGEELIKSANKRKKAEEKGEKNAWQSQLNPSSIHHRCMTSIRVKEEKTKQKQKHKNRHLKSENCGLECRTSPLLVLGPRERPSVVLEPPFLRCSPKIAVRIMQNHICVVPVLCLEHS